MKQLAFALILFSLLLLTGCYTEVVLPKHTVNKTKVDKDRIVNFTHTVIDTFYNEWLPDEGYYYRFGSDLKILKENKIDEFLNMLYAKGYNIVGAWYIAEENDCERIKYMGAYGEPISYIPKFFVLLSDVDDSISDYNFYMLLDKPYFPCPYNIWEFWSE